MCAVSAVGDNFRDNFPDRHPWYPVQPLPWTSPSTLPNEPYIHPINPIVPVTQRDLEGLASKEELEALRKDMQELKELLKAAIKYDAATNQPHCENEDKVRLIKEIAEAVGVDLSDLQLE